jgi:hypothetical protein
VRVSDVPETVKTFTVGKRRFPKTVALLVTVRALRVVVAPNEALAVTVRALRVVIPVVVRAPETVTFPPVEGLRIILEFAETWRLPLGLMAIEPKRTGIGTGG